MIRTPLGDFIPPRDNQHTLFNGLFGYLDRANLPGMSVDQHRNFLDKIRFEAQQSRQQKREEFVMHYFSKYTSETDLPLWMAAELMTFGVMLTLFRHVDKTIKRNISTEYGIADEVLESWVLTLNVIRNICAHHARLWNRGFANMQLAIPRANKHPEWHEPVSVSPDSVFGILTVLYYMLKIVAPQSQWRKRLTDLFAQYNDVPKRFMGFPDNWENCPIWK